LRSIAQSVPAVYAYGQDRAHTAGRCPPAYTPLAEGTPAEAAAEPWSDADVYDWLDAAARDAARESGGAW
jgi:hypothetical protein